MGGKNLPENYYSDKNKLQQQKLFLKKGEWKHNKWHKNKLK